MKEIEKLAREHSGTDAFLPEARMTPNALNSKLTQLENAYKAGFQKAREMAIREMLDTPHALFRLRDLGENEVDENKGSG